MASLPVCARARASAFDVPIIFNDRHVAATPNRLSHTRVLAALVRGDTILIPLRSIFEQTGAVVAYDARSRTAHVAKPGSDVQLTVGRPEVTINGAVRPLDAPPEIDDGVVLVPVRVLAEAMGAYVQWLPDRRVVVIRYAATAAPSPPPPSPSAPSPTPAPRATPAVTPPPTHRAGAQPERFVVGDYVFAPKVYNEFSAGNRGTGASYSNHGAIEFVFLHQLWMLSGDYRSYRYPHVDNGTHRRGDPGFVTVIGRYGQTEPPAFTAKNSDLDGRLGVRVAAPRMYLGVGYLHRETNYGYPKQNGVGLGLEKLPDLQHRLTAYGSAFYYPNVQGNFAYPQDAFTCPPGTATTCAPGSLYGSSASLRDSLVRYRVGVSIHLTPPSDPFGVLLDGGYLGDSVHAKDLAPSSASYAGAYLGLGIKF